MTIGDREITEVWRVIAACVRKVYDNVKNIIHLVRRPSRF
jgi:hypothetical protein